MTPPLTTTLDHYLKVKTGQDLIDLGVVPKTSSEHLALITYKRLEALRDRILSGINEEVLGKWMPAVEARTKRINSPITNPDEISKYARPGMRVVGKGTYFNKNLTGLEGVIRTIESSDKFGIEFAQPFPEGHNLDGQGKAGHCWRVTLPSFELYASDGVVIDGYKPANDFVADKVLGHLVRFTSPFTCTFDVGDSYSRRRETLEIPAGTIGTAVEYAPKAEKLTIRIDEGIPEQGRKKNFEFVLSNLYGKLEVSSLGQIAPLEKEGEVKNQTYIQFFPRTVLDPLRAERLLISMMMGKDMILYGPPGGGKSQAVKDMISIAQQQGVIFTVDGCQVQCNPFSLFDEKFAEKVPPCPECMIHYDPEFKQTGHFHKPKAKDVKVVVADYNEGHGIGFVEGTIALNRMHLAGYKLPRLDGTTSTGRESEFDTEGFHPGHLPNTNNGILHMDEMDKLRPQTLDGILEALNSNRIKPDQLAFSYPVNNLILGTANDNSCFSDALNDRMLLLAIRYPDDPDVSHAVTRRGYHEEVVPLSEVPIGDTHKEKGRILRSIPMPTIIERAVDAFYMKIRSEYTGPGKREVFGSNRCKFDALDAARAQLLLDKLFYARALDIADSYYASKGIQYAVCSRVQERNREEGQKAKDQFNAWVQKEFPDVLKREEDTWWCRAYKHIAIVKVQLPEVEANFIAELKQYEDNPRAVFKNYGKVATAYSQPKNEKAQLARVEFPFLDYLFKEQPRFEKVNEPQLLDLITYFLESRKNTSCSLGGGAGSA